MSESLAGSCAYRYLPGMSHNHPDHRRFTTLPGLRVDFADRAAVQPLAEDLGGTGRRVDILVNNAAAARSPAVDYPDEWRDRVLEVDLSSPFVLTGRIGEEMVRRGSGKGSSPHRRS